MSRLESLIRTACHAHVVLYDLAVPPLWPPSWVTEECLALGGTIEDVVIAWTCARREEMEPSSPPPWDPSTP
jgi:hypothetical protein